MESDGQLGPRARFVVTNDCPSELAHRFLTYAYGEGDCVRFKVWASFSESDGVLTCLKYTHT